MANTVDRRVVEMRFDNKDFEKNIGQTMISLESLQKALSMVDTEKGIEATKKGLLGLGKAAGAIKTDNVSENVEQISNRFSTLGIIGMSVLQDIGRRVSDLAFTISHKLLAPLNYIKQGGLTRAFNLEQANFQLSGLGIEKNDTAGYYTEVMDAVLGTAYSYDVAAKAASQLAASDVGVTEKTKIMLNGQEKATKYMTSEMTDAILGIAGVASMTGSSFEDISQVFTRVAGQGRLMSNDLNSISARGLNAAATLANYLHVSEKEVRDMVTKGQIDFETFSKAMTEAFGSHAKDSTQTFTGALEDVKAALARIGADFYGPALTGARDILNSITPLVDVIHDKIQWALDRSGVEIGKYSKKISGFLDLISVAGSTFGTKITREFSPAVHTVSTGAKSLSESLSELEHGDRVFEYLAKELGTTTNQAKAFAEQGKVSFSTWMKSLNEFLANAEDGAEGVSEVRAYLADLSAEMRKYENIADNLGITQNLVSDAFTRTAEILDVDIDKVYEAVGEKLGKTAEELKTALDNGEISMTDFRHALNELLKDGAITDEQFHNIIDVMDAFILKDERLTKKIQDAQLVWEGFTATLSILKDIAINLGGIFITLLAKLSPVGNKLREILQAFNEWIIEVDKGTNKAGIVLDTLFEKLKSLGSFITNFGSNVSKLKNNISELLDTIKEKLSGLTIFDSIKEKGKEAFAILGDGLRNLNFDKIVKALTLLVGNGLFFNFYKMVTSAGKAIKKTGASYFLFGDSFNQLQIYLWDLQNTIKYDHILRLAKAVAIMAGSMWLISTIDTGALIRATAAMSYLISELSMASNWIGKSSIGFFSKSTMVQLGISLALLATAVKILSTIDLEGLAKGLLAIKILFKELGKFMTLLSSKEFVAAAPQMGLIAKSMKKIAVALILLCIPIKILGGMDLPSLAKGLGGIGVALIIFAGFFKLMNSKIIGTTAPRIQAIAKSLFTFAIALTVLAIPIKVLGGMDIKDLGKGLGGIAGALLIFAGFFALINTKVISTTAPRIQKIAGALLVFAIALTVLAIPIKSLGSMNIKDLGKGLGAIAIALLEFAGFAALMKTVGMSSKDMLAVSASMILMGVAMTEIAGALAIMSSFDAGPGLSTLFASLLILAIAVKAMNGSIVGAAAMVVVGAALMMLAPAIALLSSLNFKGVIAGLLALAGTIGIFAAASVLLAPALPLMLALGAAIAIFGAGVLALGAGMTMLAAAFAVGVTPIINGLIAISQALPEVLKNLAIAIGAFLEVIVQEIPKLVPILEGIFEVFAEVATTYIPRLAEIGIQLIVALLEAIDGKIEDITVLALNIVQKFIDGVASKAGDLANSGLNLIVQFLQGTADAIANNGPLIIKSIESILLALLETVASAIPVFGDKAAQAIEKYRQGIDSGKKDVAKSAKDLSDTTGKNLKVSNKSINEFKKPLDDVKTSIAKSAKEAATEAGKLSDTTGKNLKIPSQTSNGSNAVKGIISGMDSQLPRLRSKANEVAVLVDKVIRKKNMIESPSKVLARTGRYLMEGLIQGIDQLTPEYQNRAENIATTMITSTNDAIDAMNSFATPNLSGAITQSSDVNLRMTDLQRENEKLANGIVGLTKSLNSMTESMNSRSLNNYINIDGSADPEAFADGLIRSFRLNARTV